MAMRRLTATVVVALIAVLLLTTGGGAFGASKGAAFISSVQLSESYVPTPEKPFSLPQSEGLKLVTDYKGLTEKDIVRPGAVDISAIGAEVTTKIGAGLSLTTTYVRSRSGIGAGLQSEPEALGLSLSDSFAAMPVRARRPITRRYFTRSMVAPGQKDKFAGAFRRVRLEGGGKVRVSLSYTEVDKRFTTPTAKLAAALQQRGLIAPVSALRGTRHIEVSVGGELAKGLKLTTSYERLRASDKKRTLLKSVGLSYGKEFELRLGEVEVEKGIGLPGQLDRALAIRMAKRSALGLGWMDREGLGGVKAIGGLRERFESLKLSPSPSLSFSRKAREISLGGMGGEVKLALEQLSLLDGALKLTRDYRRVGPSVPNVKVLGLTSWKFLNLLKGREREVRTLEFRPSKGLSLLHRSHRLRWGRGGEVLISLAQLRLGEGLTVTREYKRVTPGAPDPKQLAQMLGFGESQTYAGMQGKEREVVTAEFRPSKALGLTRRVETERALANKLQGGRKEGTLLRWAVSPKLTLSYLLENERGLNPTVHPFSKRRLGTLQLVPSKDWKVTVEAEAVAREMRIRGRAPRPQGEMERRAVRVERALKGGSVTALVERRRAVAPGGEGTKTAIRDVLLRTEVLGGLSLTTHYWEARPDRGPSQVVREMALSGPVAHLKGAKLAAQFVEARHGDRKQRGLLRVALSNLRLGEGLALTTEFKREEKGGQGVTTRVAALQGRPFKGSGLKALEGLVLTTTYRSQKPASGEPAVRREVRAALPLKDILPLVGGSGRSNLTALVVSETKGGRTTVHREFYLDTLRVAFKPRSKAGLDIGLAIGRAEHEVGGRNVPMSTIKFGGELLGLKLTGEYAVGREGGKKVVMKTWSLSGEVLGGLKLTTTYRWNQPKGKKRLSVAQVPLQWQPGGMFSLSLARQEKGGPKWNANYDRRLDVRGRVAQEQYRVTLERTGSGHFRSDLAVTNQYLGTKLRRYELGLSYSMVVSPERHELSLAARLARLDFRAPGAKDKTDYEVTLTYRLPVSW